MKLLLQLLLFQDVSWSVGNLKLLNIAIPGQVWVISCVTFRVKLRLSCVRFGVIKFVEWSGVKLTSCNALDKIRSAISSMITGFPMTRSAPFILKNPGKLSSLNLCRKISAVKFRVSGLSCHGVTFIKKLSISFWSTLPVIPTIFLS